MTAAERARRPNFLVILTDQQRGDGMGCAWPEWRTARGERSPLHTPNLDALAAGGVRLSRAYVNCPLCMPGRSSLITGLTPRAHMVRTNGINLDRAMPTITQALADAGYRTHSVGKTHFRTFGLPRGVDPQTLDPLDWPESNWMWAQGKLRKFPEPYYGVQTLDWTGGHGNVWGDYRTWLRDADTGAERLLAREAGTPPAGGAEQSWQMAIPPELHYNTWVADRAPPQRHTRTGRTGNPRLARPTRPATTASGSHSCASRRFRTRTIRSPRPIRGFRCTTRATSRRRSGATGSWTSWRHSSVTCGTVASRWRDDLGRRECRTSRCARSSPLRTA
jgi:arylsulfatase A-like enzyme